MGTTQDFAVAAEEGATIVRIGSQLCPVRSAATGEAAQRKENAWRG